MDDKSRYKLTKQIGVGGVAISRKAKAYVNDVLNSGRLTYGKYCQKFENMFAQMHERKFAIVCNSGTSALQVAVHALKNMYEWKDGDEVIIPTVTFVASCNVLLQNRLQPVFVDVERDYYELDPAKIENAITPKTRAIMVVHLFGQPCDMDPIVKIAKRHKLEIIEDSCETVFARYKGKYAGSWGKVACFSTYAAHTIVTGVGGLVVTDDAKLAIFIKSLFNHGRDGIYLSSDDDKGKKGTELFQIVERRFSFIDVGYSYRVTEMEAALGVAQLEEKETILKRRLANAAYLLAGLSDLDRYLQLPKTRPETEYIYMVFTIVCRQDNIRDKLIFYLEDNLVETRYMMPMTNQPIYKKLFGIREEDYPVAKWINRNGFYVGCHPGMKKKELDYMIGCIHQFFKKTIKSK